MNFGSFKDLERVRLKATSNIEINGKEYVPGETIAYFDSIQIAGLQTTTARTAARGGYDNRAHVVWETTKEINLSFTQGVFNKTQFGLMSNSKRTETDELFVGFREELEIDENLQVECKYTPARNCFVYVAADGIKLQHAQDGKVLTFEGAAPYTNIIVDYDFLYENDIDSIFVGQRACNGFLELEGFTRLKDDTTGQVTTGIVQIPKLKLMSDLSIRLGDQATPITIDFYGQGYPVGYRGDSYVAAFHFLGDDLKSDL